MDNTTLRTRALGLIRRRSRIILSALALCLVAACEAEPVQTREPPAITEGLTVLEAKPGLSARIAYKKGERLVFVETQRGEETPQEYLDADPTAPRFGTDVKVRDRHGAIIYARYAGEQIDPEEEEAQEHTPEQIEAHAQDVELAEEALFAAEQALANLGPDFADFREQVGEIGRIFETLIAEQMQFPEDTEIAAHELSPVTKAAASNAYKHGVWLWKAPLKKAGVTYGWHSATRIANYSGNKWVNVKDQCNHGRCPHGDGMKLDCSYVSGKRANSRIPGHCSTKNQWASVNTHNCNDDSHLQVINIRYNKSHATDKGSCKDKGPNPDPDGCDPKRW